MNNMSLNCTDPLTDGYFSVGNTIVLYDPELTEIWMKNLGCCGLTAKLYVDFQLCGGLVPLTPTLFKGQP